MTFKFRCPHCFRKIAAEDEYKGTNISCPSCERSIRVPEAQFGAGKDIGGFVIEQWLGNGSMGEVHLAKQPAMDRMVALKIMTHDKLNEEDDQQRFVREIQTLAKLNHPNIVSAISAGEFDEGSYLAMTYINGMTAEDKVIKGGPMTEKEAFSCCLAVADALKYAWENAKVLHRDLKPANFMIDESHHVHLMDMGIAKSMDNDNDITMAGVIMGTPYYMSPEQARAERNLDQRSDIYSLGASLYHMLTGLPPFNGGSAMQVMGQKLRENPVPPQEINSHLSNKACKVIKKFMAIDVDKRPQNWEEAIQLLHEAKSSKKAGKKIHINSHPETIGTKAKVKPQNGSFLPVLLIISIIIICIILFIVFK